MHFNIKLKNIVCMLKVFYVFQLFHIHNPTSFFCTYNPISFFHIHNRISFFHTHNPGQQGIF